MTESSSKYLIKLTEIQGLFVVDCVITIGSDNILQSFEIISTHLLHNSSDANVVSSGNVLNLYGIHRGSLAQDFLSQSNYYPIMTDSTSGYSYNNAYNPNWNSFDNYGISITTLGMDIDMEIQNLLSDISSNYTYNLTALNQGGMTSTNTDNRIFINFYNNDSGNRGQYVATMSVSPYNVSCFAKNTRVRTNLGDIPIQSLSIGTLLTTLTSGDKEVVCVGKRVVPSSVVKMYTFMDSELEITEKHSLLVDEITEEEKEEIPYVIGKLKQTEGEWLLPVCLHPDALELYTSGNIELFHIVLENDDDDCNYGILAEGKWVESCSKNDFVAFSQMKKINS